MVARLAGVRKLIALADLQPSPYNPPGRVSKRALKALVDSLDLLGQLAPVVVSPTKQIIDGHRRVAAARELGWKEIECVTVELRADMTYASVNTTARPMSGNDALCVWLAHPLAAPAHWIPRFNEMQEALGPGLCRKIAQAGLSYRVFRTARQIARYCEDDSRETLKKVVEWLLAFAVIGHVMKAMEAGVSPKVIMLAVKKKKPVKLSLEVG